MIRPEPLERIEMRFVYFVAAASLAACLLSPLPAKAECTNGRCQSARAVVRHTVTTVASASVNVSHRTAGRIRDRLANRPHLLRRGCR